jgi:molybdopterin/thiamine biosynthesis adenylyltransferase
VSGRSEIEDPRGEPGVPRSSLVLLPRCWREQIPELASSGGLGLASLTRNHTESTYEWIAHDLRPIPRDPQGRQFGPLEDLLLLQVLPQVAADSALRLLAAFAPLPSQVVISLVLGFGHAAGHWVGQVWELARIRRLDGFRLVGPGMPFVTSEPLRPRAGLESDAVQGRWSRTRGALGDEVWQRVHRSTIGVVGAGRNGSAAAMTLTLLGVPTLILIDDDRDELPNLDATPGATPEGLGQFKALNRSAALRRLRPTDLEVIPVCRSLLDLGVSDHLCPVDLIVTCVDQDAPRLAAAMMANRWGKVHLDIGTGILTTGSGPQAGADIRLLLPGEACVVCLGGLANLEEARSEVAAPYGALRRGRRLAWFEQRAGSLITINQVAVNLGIQLWLDLLAGRVTGSRWCRLEWNPRGELQVRQMQTTTEECSLCRRQRPLRRAT